MDIKEAITNIFMAYWYNGDDVINVINEVRNRIYGNDCEYTFMGDLIYSFIILCYGEYGTSPRSGWLIKNYEEEILNILTDIRYQYETVFMEG